MGEDKMRVRHLSCVIIAIMVLFPLLAKADITGLASFSPKDFSFEQFMERDSNKYTIITPLGHGAYDFPGNPGDPELPAENFLYSLPLDMEVDTVLVSYFVQDGLSEIQDPYDTNFVPPGLIYKQKEIYPAEKQLGTCINPVSFIRGSGVATVQIRPVRYDIINNKLLLITNIRFQIVLKPASERGLPPGKKAGLCITKR